MPKLAALSPWWFAGGLCRDWWFTLFGVVTLHTRRPLFEAHLPYWPAIRPCHSRYHIRHIFFLGSSPYILMAAQGRYHTTRRQFFDLVSTKIWKKIPHRCLLARRRKRTAHVSQIRRSQDAEHAPQTTYVPPRSPSRINGTHTLGSGVSQIVPLRDGAHRIPTKRPGNFARVGILHTSYVRALRSAFVADSFHC